MNKDDFEKVYEPNEKVIIRKNPNGDTRTAPKGITFEQFDEANWSHKMMLKMLWINYQEFYKNRVNHTIGLR